MPRWVVAVAAVALVAAACGGDDDDASSTTAAAADEPAATTTTSGTASGVNLAGVCPDPLVMQMDWEPESEHGGLYQLVGDGYTIDTDAKRVRGPMVASGEATGIDIEIRIGGNAVGFQQTGSLMYQDPDIFLGMIRLVEAMEFNEDLPVVAVYAMFEKSPFSVYWDPETYPNAETVADLKDEGVVIMLGRPDSFQDYWLAEGIMDESQMDLSDMGKPAAFIGRNGEWAEAGFATAEPFLYEFEVPEWGKPVKVQLIHDTGWEEYFQAMAVRTEDLTAGNTAGWYTTIDREPFEWSYDTNGDGSADVSTRAPRPETGTLLSGPRWLLTPNKIGQDIPGLEVPNVECAPPPYQKDLI